MRKLIAFCCLLAAGTTAAAEAQVSPNSRYQTYVETYAPLAVAEMQVSRIPASITLAQGLLESGGGSSSLATESNNHFGIKCGSSWEGRTHHHEDDDYQRGRLTKSCFRAYGDPAESYRDHSAFLTGSQRYAGLFDLDPADYAAWAHGLKAAGYATSPTYAHKLIEIIETYDLARYDQGLAGLPLADRTLTEGTRRDQRDRYGAPVLTGAKLPSGSRPSGSDRQTSAGGATPSSRSTPGHARQRSSVAEAVAGVQSVNDVEFVLVLPGESVNDVARRGRVGARDLVRYNETLTSIDDRLAAGQRVYLQPKRGNYRGRQKKHRVGATETTQTVADLYGLSTAGLKRRNRIAADEEPARGEQLVIRGRRPRNDDPRVMSATRRRAQVAEEAQAGVQPGATPTRETAPTAAMATATATASATPASQREVPTVIILPPAGAPAEASATTGAIGAARPTGGQAAPTGHRTAGDEPSVPEYVTVGRGDTLFAISRASGTSVAEIRALNGLDGDTIRVGQRLLVRR